MLYVNLLVNFLCRVQEHPGLTYLGAREGKTPDENEAIVKFDGPHQVMKFAVTRSAIYENEWDQLLAVLTGLRSPRIMTHICRIVGYYSMLQNWNPSKIAEHNDRRKGNYVLEEPKVRGDGNVETQLERETCPAPGEPARV